MGRLISEEEGEMRVKEDASVGDYLTELQRWFGIGNIDLPIPARAVPMLWRASVVPLCPRPIFGNLPLASRGDFRPK